MTTAIREGLFRESDTGPTLLAAECTTCGRTVFPSTRICLECGGEAIAPVELGALGELLCATVVHMGSGGFKPGYSVGYVMMPRGVRVFTQIVGSGETPLPSGTPMRLEIAPLWPEDKPDVLGYRFTPSTAGEDLDA